MRNILYINPIGMPGQEQDMTTETTSQHLTSYQSALITEARRLVSITTVDGERAYLREHDSPYADDPDPGMVSAAFGGHLRHVLNSVTRVYEQEITRDA